MDTDNQESIFDGLNYPFALPRKDMIPKWIRFFCWVFAFLGFIGAICSILWFVTPFKVYATIYSFSTNSGSPLIALTVFALFLLKGLTAIGLLTEKKWAVKLAIVDGIIGITLCVFSMIYTWHSGFQFRLEIFLLVPYLVIMLDIRKDWEANRFAIQQVANIIQ